MNLDEDNEKDDGFVEKDIIVDEVKIWELNLLVKNMIN